MSRISTLHLKSIFSSRKAIYAIASLLLTVSWMGLGWSPFSPRVVRSKAPFAEAITARRSLSIEERVRYQRAVEEVYWRHSTWPEQSATAKPSLDEISPLEATRAKVEDTLCKSEALAQFWKRPVTAEQLQAEMMRMSRESKQPEVLRELQRALDNDPFVIAEVLARPILVERLLRHAYAYDNRFHDSLRARAEADLRTHVLTKEMRQMGGSFSQVEAVKVAQKLPREVSDEDSAGAEAVNGATAGELKLTPAEWDAETARLAATFDTGDNDEQFSAHSSTLKLPVGRLSRLREDTNSFYVTSVTEKKSSHLKVARVEWAKTSFDSWWASARGAYAANAAPAGEFSYRLPEASPPASTVDDTWTPTQALPITTGTAVWTGTEMIIWGGYITGGRTNSGARYNPSTDTWSPISTINAPSPRRAHTAIWTGTEMIVWGGCGQLTDFCGLADGGRYNPNTDTWTPISNANAPRTRSSHTAVWTGSTMIIWGGCAHGYNNQCTSLLNTGGIYNPAADSWTATSTVNAPSPRSGHRAVWTGADMIVWGPSNTGGRYNPSTDTWRSTNTFNAPSARSGFTSIWTGSEMVIWGGYEGNFVTLNTGGRYNPSTDTWTPTTTMGAPAPRYSHTAVWTGTEMIVYGGDLRIVSNETGETNTGGRYNPLTDTWTQTATLDAPPKAGHVAVWTGTEMIVWSISNLKEGGRYKPSTDSWIPINNDDAAPPVDLGVWSGTEMIVWGRNPDCISGCYSVGGRYNPATYSWRPINTINTPPPGVSGRPDTAVWTGREMLVWGATDGTYGAPGEGAKYDPFTDNWTRISTVNAPVNRAFHTAVWTGNVMIVWGGESNDGSKQNTGGRYNPTTNTWTPTSMTGAPDARYLHTAVWTGSEMIVWGGVDATAHTNTGGRYNPNTDSWTPTSSAGAPSERRFHSAVWTGTEMVVWGGMTGDFNNTSGLLNTGGRYNPATDSWQATSLLGAPSPRKKHSAVWTGSLIIIWGGSDSSGATYTGGRYNPSADAWTPTSTLRAPSRRQGHIAVWTGAGMIIWSGATEEGTAAHGAIYFVPGASPANNPPSVSIISPPNGSGYESGANIFINIAASDSDGTVSTVHFYANDTLIGSDSVAPFNFTWNEVRGGGYSLTAVATDNNGGVANSSPVTINVNVSTAPPICALTSPTNGATYTAPADVAISTNAQANRDRTLSKVEFFDGERAVGTYTNGPYGYTWTNIPEGTHSFYVRCTDSAGSVTTSPTSVVTVNPSTTMYRITGMITNSGGSVIPNLRVRLDSPQSTTPVYATTNLNGSYQFYSLTSGASYTVTPESTNYSFSPASLSYGALSQNDDNANFVATQIGYGISGRVTDASGNALYPATLNLSGSATRTTSTDSTGYYFFSNLTPGGTYTVQPYKNQHTFEPAYRTFSNLSAEQTADFTGTTVQKQTPTVTWNNPANITYGTPLSSTQLNATANTPGTFVYNPSAGTVLNVGTHQLSVTFTPADTANYTTASKTVSLTVDPVTAAAFNLNSATYTVNEGDGHVTLTVNRTGGGGAASVNYTTSDTAALTNCNVFNGNASSRCDYATTIGTLRFAAGEISKTIFIPVVDDAWAEGIEAFSLSLSNPTGAVLGATTSATITITDNESVTGSANPIAQTAFFVRQQYVDFLGREPDSVGLAGWQGILSNCPSSGKDANGNFCDRIEVSAGFFRSEEFQSRGYFIYKFYSALGRIPLYPEFIPDLAKVSGFLSAQQLEDSKAAFVTEFMARSEFQNKYGAITDPSAYVNALLTTVGLPNHPSRAGWIAGLNNGSLTRARVLRELTESSEMQTKYSTESFVIMQYFGYLRRSADASYLAWIDIMNQNPNNYRGMIDGFINSDEYRKRFGQ
jgi:N-acetylneuraminic acid mutarotase